MIASTHSASLWGTESLHVTVEAHVQGGLPSFTVVGLPDNAVKESRERVRSAIINTGFEFPPRRVTVNLAPADVRKEGGIFDLPIAAALMGALGHVPGGEIKDYLFVGELGLDGSVRAVPGVICAAFLARQLGMKGLVCPLGNVREATLAGVRVWGITRLPDLVRLFRGELAGETAAPPSKHDDADMGPDLSEVSGQPVPKRALMIAAAGGHNLLFVGPPGTGKSMLAGRLPGILPALSVEELLECTRIYSAAGRLPAGGIVNARPFRTPHHTISDAGMIGGGQMPTPGEITLAHHGVLFLDELPEFKRGVLEALRQPLEEGMVTVSRAQAAINFPARFQLVAAMNPCPCGYTGHPGRECRCTPTQLSRYRTRISGPLLDRIDLSCWVDPVDPREILDKRGGTASAEVRARVDQARARQLQRGVLNAAISDREFDRLCPLDRQCRTLLLRALSRHSLSMRGYKRVIKVGRTIADLAGDEHLREEHVAEALQYRPSLI